MATNQIANVKMRLKGFEESDTNSQLEGYVEPGKYPVVEVKKNHPTADTDYILILAPHLGAGDTWICSRWKNQEYATLQDVPAKVDLSGQFDNDDSAIEGSYLLDILPQFNDFTYDLDEARYPTALPGVRVPLAPPAQNNCCTFVEALVVEAWAAAVPNFNWGNHRHAQMMIYSADDFFSPITAVVEAEMAVQVADVDAPPPPWTVIQGWRSQWRGGHTFFIVDHHEETDAILTLESNSAYKLNGVGFRGIGNLRDTGGVPPENWWETPGIWTWQKLISTYRFREMAALKVKNIAW